MLSSSPHTTRTKKYYESKLGGTMMGKSLDICGRILWSLNFLGENGFIYGAKTYEVRY